MPTPEKLLIVGRGIAGMALAIGLKRAGIDSEIVEISSHWTVGGLGIGLGGPALRARLAGILWPPPRHKAGSIRCPSAKCTSIWYKTCRISFASRMPTCPRSCAIC